MSGTTISGATTIGLSLKLSSQNPVTVTSTGVINVANAGGSAIYGAYGVFGTIVNAGLIEAAAGYGIRLLSGGTVTNGSANNTTAVISGGEYGVRFGIHGAGVLSNFGTIASTDTAKGVGVMAGGTGTVTNGSVADTSALITGYYDGVRLVGPGSVVNNFGTVLASAALSNAVYLRAGGTITNGTSADTKALLNGGEIGANIQHAAGTVLNFGTIEGTGAVGRGVLLQDGGLVVNGSSSDTAAYIFGASHNAVYIGGASGTVFNYGTIRASGLSALSTNGVVLIPGGTVVNGSALDTTAYIVGSRSGIYEQGLVASEVVNFGTIRSLSRSGVSVGLSAQIINGSSADTKALITGATGIYTGAGGTVTNAGTVLGSGTAIFLKSGGAVINGSTADTAALINGSTGLWSLTGPTTVSNFGTIRGTAGSALILSGGGSLSNSGTASLITATNNAVYTGGAAVGIVNAGSIIANGTALFLNGGGSVANGSAANTTAAILGGSQAIRAAGMETVSNFGTLASTFNDGVDLDAGGVVTNGSTADTAARIIGSGDGIFGGATGVTTVTNYGTIADTSTITGVGIGISGNGTVTNGASAGSAALITGFYQGVDIRGFNAKLINFATITGTALLGDGAYLQDGGTITNGGTGDTSALIAAPDVGVEISHAAGTVTNFGTIEGTGTSLVGWGVILKAGGTVLNGSTSDTSAYIVGDRKAAVYVGPGTAAGYVHNFGTIATGSASNSDGVDLRGVGTVVNGGDADTKATISGYSHGIYMQGGAGSVVRNDGTVSGQLRSAVSMYLGGTVSNGEALDKVALISGPGTGVYLGGAGTVTNFGTIKTGGTALDVLGQAVIVNGSAADTTALITSTGTASHSGIYVGAAAASVTNFGTIASASASALHLNGGGTVMNGSTADRSALIAGQGDGIYVQSGAVSITNFGTISAAGGMVLSSPTGTVTAIVTNAGTITNGAGSAGTAIGFSSTGPNRLIDDPGAVFVGTVAGSGSTTLELAVGGAGSISGLGTIFTGMTQVVVDAGATWTVTGTNAAADIVNNGTLTVATGAVLNAPTIDPSSAGIFQLNAGAVLSLGADAGSADKIKFMNTNTAVATTMTIGVPSAFGTLTGTADAGPLIENFTSIDRIDLANVAFANLSAPQLSTTDVLSVIQGGTVVARLAFDKTTLGSGNFIVQADQTGHTYVTLT